ncbi:WDR3 [Symbiodinium natans]|uniref:WDR3 protein n=1 Tax=Symbiodinium natans TaxID=878477 RepID=A0A812L690_9DINO|nr:WDR3 [Symbiodinium natans]
MCLQTADTVEEAAEEEDHAADEFTHLQTHRCTGKALSMAWNGPQSAVLLGLTNNVLETLRISPAEGDEDAPALQLESSLSLELCGHRTGVRALAVAQDDSMFLSLSNEAVKVWSASTARCVRTIASGYGLCGFFLAGNEHVLIGTKEGQLELYNIQLGEQAQTMDAHSGAVYGLALRPDNQGCVSCSADKSLRFFDIKFVKGAETSVSLVEQPDRATELPDELLAVCFSANGHPAEHGPKI